VRANQLPFFRLNHTHIVTAKQLVSSPLGSEVALLFAGGKARIRLLLSNLFKGVFCNC
jgi:hypothetical protein